MNTIVVSQFLKVITITLFIAIIVIIPFLTTAKNRISVV
jgi:hypothetical protein